ncbi:hypothetical protein E4S40_07220 [Algoriphagus kandeliae]|uniref:IPT/TIG domain-containing protein n=1 Tax=Algoriphagus kandeliae TaxID=2562278 RepID=A0A4Y9QU34_9BACT|nr:IPT/TIG domain-containing protein [Algoriphagus kandeliae]TFV96009.1 hypothetical protein E4S40_07220 [Algoriphagus kandeliae]
MKNIVLPLLFLFLVFQSCKEESEDPQPIDSFTSSLEGDLAGQSLSIGTAGIQSTYFSDQGEITGALEVGAQLPNSERLTFFINEVKDGTVNLSQEFPAVMGLGSFGLRKNESKDNKRIANTPPSFVKYANSQNTFFAISGKIVIKIDGDNLTFEWEVIFKDAQGNTFTSKGSAKIKDYKSIQRPRSQINSPASNLSITSISPDYGPAGMEVTIKGTGFSALKSENSLKLGDLDLGELTSASATELKVTVPENGTHGKFYLTVLGASAESGSFFYEPIIESVDKNAAKLGEEVVINGKHFDADASLLEVKVGEKVMEILSATLTKIVFKIPEGTDTGSITVSRKGKPAVEGPELTITAEPVNVGPPINEIFEVISGELTFEEVIVNSHEYGPFWNLEIDKEKNILYAVGEKGLVSINLSTKSITKVVDTSNEIFRSEIGIINALTIPQTIFAAPDGNLYGIKSVFGLPLSPNNVFKMNLESKAVTMLGNSKFNNGAGLNGIFVGANKSIYIPEFASGYHLAAYDENLANRNLLIEDMTGGLATFIIPMGENSFRLVRDNTLNSLKYHEINGTEASGEIAMGATLSGMQVGGQALTQPVGLDQTGGDIYGLFGGAEGNVANYPQFEYTLGVQQGATGNFQKKGGFRIKQTFEYQGTTYYVSSRKTFNKIMGVDKDGSIYFLVSTPMTSQGVQVAGPLGGIYKVSF